MNPTKPLADCSLFGQVALGLGANLVIARLTTTVDRHQQRCFCSPSCLSLSMLTQRDACSNNLGFGLGICCDPCSLILHPLSPAACLARKHGGVTDVRHACGVQPKSNGSSAKMRDWNVRFGQGLQRSSPVPAVARRAGVCISSHPFCKPAARVEVGYGPDTTVATPKAASPTASASPDKG